MNQAIGQAIEDGQKTWSAETTAVVETVRGYIAPILAETSLRSYALDLIPTGSSQNETAVGTSDVDILVMPLVDPTDLPHTVSDRQALFAELYREIEQALRAEGETDSSVAVADKCMNLFDGSRIQPSIDLIPCLPYDYQTPSGENRQGIELWTQTGERVINDFRTHKLRSDEHESGSDGTYKETVRMLKIARDGLVSDGVINPSSAHSYQIECAVYAATNRDSKSLSPLQRMTTIAEGYMRALKPGALHNVLTINERHLLFGNGMLQWHPHNALEFFKRLHEILT